MTKERPIQFSGEMVRAILAGKKTETRRVVKFKTFHSGVVPHKTIGHVCRDSVTGGGWVFFGRANERGEMTQIGGLDPKYGKPGDRLYVKETWMPFYRVGNINSPAQEGIIYRADDSRLTANVRGHWKADRVGKWRPGMIMPRIFSRILLEVTKPERVERLQDITDEDVIAEGVAPVPIEQRLNDNGELCASGKYVQEAIWCSSYCTKGQGSYTMAFAKLWDSINAVRGFGWDTNPWVRVVSFKLLEVKAAIKEGENA